MVVVVVLLLLPSWEGFVWVKECGREGVDGEEAWCETYADRYMRSRAHAACGALARALALADDSPY